MFGMRNPAVFSMLAEKFPDAFIGLSDVANEGQYLWNDMISVEKTWKLWGPNEPNNNDVGDDCGFMKNFTGAISLSVVDCSILAMGLCEAPIGYPAQIPTYKPKNNCEYVIIPPSTQDVGKRLCEQLGGKLAVKAVNDGNVLKKILHYFNSTGHTDGYDGVYTGFKNTGSMFEAAGVSLALPNTAAQRKPGSPDTFIQDCLIALLNPDWLNYAWVDDVSCYEMLPSLCEICEERKPLDLRTCKSGKVCPFHTICVINEGSCFEECICVDGYVKINDSTPACIRDKCIGYDCGGNATCVFDPMSNFVQCKCDKGYLPRGKEGEGCYNPCDGVSCQAHASCVVHPYGGNQTGRCVCDVGYMPDMTNTSGCIEDQCHSEEITCKNNAYCTLTGLNPLTQGCACEDGFHYETEEFNSCGSCPQSQMTFPRQDKKDFARTHLTIPEISSVTVCAWVAPPTGEVLDGGLFAFADEEQPNAFAVIFETPSRHGLYFGSPSNRRTEFTVTVSSQTHLCYVVSQPTNQVRLYFDGTIRSSKTISAFDKLPASNGIMVIGRDQDSFGGDFDRNQGFKGTINNLMMWYRELSHTEISTMYNDGCSCASDIDFALAPGTIRVHGQVTATYEACADT